MKQVFHTVQVEGCTSSNAFPTDGNDTIVKAVADTLEILYEDALKYLATGDARLSPSECSVLDDLRDFRRLECAGLHSPHNVPGDSSFYRDAVFFYVNLNTGKSVAWFLHLKV